MLLFDLRGSVERSELERNIYLSFGGAPYDDDAQHGGHTPANRSFILQNEDPVKLQLCRASSSWRVLCLMKLEPLKEK